VAATQSHHVQRPHAQRTGRPSPEASPSPSPGLLRKGRFWQRRARDCKPNFGRPIDEKNLQGARQNVQEFYRNQSINYWHVTPDYRTTNPGRNLSGIQASRRGSGTPRCYRILGRHVERRRRTHLPRGLECGRSEERRTCLTPPAHLGVRFTNR
jgi:hypothetical protein